jgi:hypothetical protein
MYSVIILPHRFLHIKENNKTFKYRDILITNDKKYIDNCLSKDPVKQACGKYLIEKFNEGCYAFTIYKSSETSDLSAIQTKIFSIQGLVNDLFNNLWLIEDTNVFFPEAYFINTETGEIRRNYNNLFLRRADCSQKTSTLDQNMFDKLTDLTQKTNLIKHLTDKSIILPNKLKDKQTIIFHLNDLFYNRLTRINRAFILLNKARGEDYIILKISLLISLLESLFNSSKDEISKSVRQRASSYLGGNIGKVKENERLINKAYDIRSKYLHGQIIETSSKNFEKQVEIVLELDKIIRGIFNKLIEDKGIYFLEKNKEKFDEYFNSLVSKYFPLN